LPLAGNRIGPAGNWQGNPRAAISAAEEGAQARRRGPRTPSALLTALLPLPTERRRDAPPSSPTSYASILMRRWRPASPQSGPRLSAMTCLGEIGGFPPSSEICEYRSRPWGGEGWGEVGGAAAPTSPSPSPRVKPAGLRLTPRWVSSLSPRKRAERANRHDA